MAGRRLRPPPADGRPETLAAIFTDFISSRAEKIWPPPPSLPVAMELAVDDITGDEVRACMSVCVCVSAHTQGWNLQNE